MFLLSLFSILYCLGIFNALSLDKRDVELKDKTTEILGIDSDYESIAIATRDQIYIHNQNSRTSDNYIGSIILPKVVSKDPGFLALKLISRTQVFYCDSFNCGLCTLSNNTTSCSSLELDWLDYKIKELSSVAFTRALDKIVLRVVDTRDRAAVITYPLKDKGKLQRLGDAEDAPYMLQLKTVGAFSRGTFSYFVSSAYQPYEPFINARLGSQINKTMTKITRICSTDGTRRLESRIDLAFLCGKDDLAHLEASYYDDQRDILTVVTSSGNKLWSVCQLDMIKVNTQFDNDWKTCQQLSMYDDQRDCAAARSIESLPDHCYIFTHQSESWRMMTCVRFGLGDTVYDNCELSNHKGTADHFGWLENFKPVPAQLIAQIQSEKIKGVKSVVPTARSDAVFLAVDTEEGEKVIRIRSTEELVDDTTGILWSAPVRPRSLFPMSLDERGEKIYLVNSTTVSSIALTCPELYHDCESLARGGWKDPLACVWCHKDDNGEAMSSINTFSKFLCDKPITKVCPPVIDHANRNDNHSEWEIFGTNLDNMENTQIFICGQPCIMNKDQSKRNKYLCYLANGSVQDDTCSVKLIGRLGEYDDFVLNVKKTTSSIGTMTPVQNGDANKGSSSRAWKAIVAVIAVVILIGVLVLMVYLVRKHLMRQRNMRKANDNRHRPFQMPAPINHQRNTYVDNGGFPMVPLASNYEQLFSEIEDEIRIESTDLRIMSEVGKGHFGRVYKARYQKDNLPEIMVACKTINTEGNSTAKISEFIREGLIMHRFNHPRVMKLLGISITSEKMPIIVTPYMSRGDLVSYLRDEQNFPTLRILLRFAQQIAEGMEYLHSQNFIHRDLAARNCMLDEMLNVKIADFGLARETIDKEYMPSVMKRDLPLRWMAIEAIEHDQFTFKGDVWSFGVVIWELTTRGSMPYQDKTTGLAVLEALKSGARLNCPIYCPPALYNRIMYPCWYDDPDDRPEFSKLVRDVIDLTTDLERSQQSQMSSHYERASSTRVADQNSMPNGSSIREQT